MSLLDQLSDGVRGGASKGTAPIVVVKLGGDPFGKQDPQHRIVTPKGGGKPFAIYYNPTETKDYEARLRAAAIDAMAGRKILDEALDLLVFAYFPIPESWTERKREAALAGLIRPTVKPDWDNIGKTIDALSPHRDKKTGVKVPIIWRDDALVVDGRVVKVYARRKPGIIVEVRPAGVPPQPWSPE